MNHITSASVSSPAFIALDAAPITDDKLVEFFFAAANREFAGEPPQKARKVSQEATAVAERVDNAANVLEGFTYNGEMLHGLAHGKGTMTYTNGDVYEGLFQNGQRHGKGKLTDKDGKVIYEGDYQGDQRRGNGTIIGSNGDIYVGDYVNIRQPHGKGKLTDRDGYVYEGDFQNGDRHGNGKLTDKNGKVLYKGTFLKGRSAPSSQQM